MEGLFLDNVIVILAIPENFVRSVTRITEEMTTDTV